MKGALSKLRHALRPIYHAGSNRCTACGSWMRTVKWPVMWDQLGEDWELSETLYWQMDEREGRVCPFCFSNQRVRLLAKTLLADIRRTKGRRSRSVAELASRFVNDDLKIAEINAVSYLHPFLARLPNLSFSEYGSTDPAVPNEDLMGLSYEDAVFDYVLTSDTLEHVPDFDRAMKEIRRVLKPGGKHIFTIPVIWERSTRQRATLDDDGVHHILPPSHHAGPQINQEDYLVFNEFGGDVVERIANAGFSVDVVKDRKNSLVSTIIATRPFNAASR